MHLTSPARCGLLSRASLSVRFSSSWPPKIRAYKPVDVRKYTQMRVRTNTHERARARVSAYSRPSLAAGKKEGKKKGATDGRSGVQICERYHVGRNAEIASRCLLERTHGYTCPLVIDAPATTTRKTLPSNSMPGYERFKSRRLSHVRKVRRRRSRS